MQYLYRAYGPQNQLLYVGISGNWSERLHSHERNSEWMQLTDFVKLERYPTREAVEKAERQAIVTESPIFNKMHNLSFESAKDHFQTFKFWTYRKVIVDDTHAALIEKMRQTLPLLGVDYKKKQARYVALLFFIHYEELKESGDLDCRNCQAIFEHKQIQQWAEAGSASVREAQGLWTS
jgi:predicted GIY-YIG superfamily endonuclease